MMLHTKYRDSRPLGFKQEECFHILSVQHVTLGEGPFLLHGHNVYKLGKGLQDDTTY